MAICGNLWQSVAICDNVWGKLPLTLRGAWWRVLAGWCVTAGLRCDAPAFLTGPFLMFTFACFRFKSGEPKAHLRVVNCISGVFGPPRPVVGGVQPGPYSVFLLIKPLPSDCSRPMEAVPESHSIDLANAILKALDRAQPFRPESIKCLRREIESLKRQAAPLPLRDGVAGFRKDNARRTQNGQAV